MAVAREAPSPYATAVSSPDVQVLTAPGAGGVAVVRVNGPGATSVVRRAFRGRRWPEVGQVAYGELCDAGGRVDDVLLTRVEDEGYELGCHAGPAVQRQVLAALEAAGARAAAAPRTLADELERALGAAVSRRVCVALLAQPARWGAICAQPVDATLLRRLERSAIARRLLEPSLVALRGAPNAGKSSLLNALVGRARALVSPRPGTTRDAVRVPAVAGGLPLTLVDTAGDRATPDALEQAGIARARQAAAGAALRLVVVDGTQAELPSWLPEEAAPRLVVRSKADLVDPARRAPGVWVSARSGEGVAALGVALAAELVPDDVLEGAFAFTPRQQGWVVRASELLRAGDPAGAQLALRRVVAEDPQPVTRP